MSFDFFPDIKNILSNSNFFLQLGHSLGVPDDIESLIIKLIQL